ncbi:RNA polymerase II transcription factor SIII subunit A-domain-containing protein [Chaetomium tenue]|uniref:RNA polymerase II transcription factor SIII subunit A-domain-containing protein n=1 Tax=Chaetomium tenue TaxID=1854479 RepID=A0ACB7PNL0_9PEZI|nr:RNA polymerase II transcription factor SIII subunit A-domain-containing protein [Chaetomium globosum]
MDQQRTLVQTSLGPRLVVEVPLGARSLAEMSLKVAIDNVKMIQSLGDIPPCYLDPILQAVKSAEQLHVIEINSYDIYDETEKHWKRIIKKDFPILANRHDYAPQNRKSWHKIYDKYKQLDNEQLAAATEKLMKGFAVHTQEKQSRASTIISAEKGGKLRKAKAKPGFNTPRSDGSFISNTRAQLRREAFRFSRPTPSGQLPVQPNQIKKPPPAMVDDHRRMAYGNSIPEPPPMIRTPRQRSAPNATGSVQNRNEGESRLLQIKNGGQPNTGPAKNVLSFSDDEGPNDSLPNDADLFGDADDDDLFGDLEQENKPSSASSPQKSRPAPRPVPTQSSKRRRNVEDIDTGQPTKRPRGFGTTTTSALLLPNKAPNQPLKPRPKGLSAAPGTNQALRKIPPGSSPKAVAPSAAPLRRSFPAHTGFSQSPRGHPPLDTTPLGLIPNKRQMAIANNRKIPHKKDENGKPIFENGKSVPMHRQVGAHAMIRPPKKLKSP